MRGSRVNRKKYAQVGGVVPTWWVGLLGLMAIVAVAYVSIGAKCSQLGDEIRKHEQHLAALEKERIREDAHWNEKKTPENLSHAMLSHGLEMDYPAADQIVRLDAHGNLAPGQPSLERIAAARKRVVSSVAGAR